MAKKEVTLADRAYKALGKKPIKLTELITKLGLVEPDGEIKPYTKKKVRDAVGKLRADGKVVMHGDKGTAAYART